MLYIYVLTFNTLFMKQIHKAVIGTKYRDWEVIDDKIYKISSNRATYWKVKCKCGYEALRAATHLVKNKVGACRSCCKLKNPIGQNYLNRIKERAKISNFSFDITLEYIMNLLKDQNYKCKLSGLEIEMRKQWYGNVNQTASLDRIDNNKGYIKGNVQWLHKDINNMKHTHSETYFLELCKLIVDNKC